MVVGGRGCRYLLWVGCVACVDGVVFFFFFFQAEDGIRDTSVTGVQTCALPILPFLWVSGAPEPPKQGYGVAI